MVSISSSKNQKKVLLVLIHHQDTWQQSFFLIRCEMARPRPQKRSVSSIDFDVGIMIGMDKRGVDRKMLELCGIALGFILMRNDFI